MRVIIVVVSNNTPKSATECACDKKSENYLHCCYCCTFRLFAHYIAPAAAGAGAAIVALLETWVLNLTPNNILIKTLRLYWFS